MSFQTEVTVISIYINSLGGRDGFGFFFSLSFVLKPLLLLLLFPEIDKEMKPLQII